MTLLAIFCGGGLGAVARYLFAALVHKQFGALLPWGTLAVNIAGAFAMGLLAGLFALKINAPEPMRLFLTVGFLGGFTTFSAFSLEAALMLQKGDYLPLIIYVSLSVAGTIAGLLAAMQIVRILA